jgi:hypothetical protein
MIYGLILFTGEDFIGVNECINCDPFSIFLHRYTTERACIYSKKQLQHEWVESVLIQKNSPWRDRRELPTGNLQK